MVARVGRVEHREAVLVLLPVEGAAVDQQRQHPFLGERGSEDVGGEVRGQRLLHGGEACRTGGVKQAVGGRAGRGRHEQVRQGRDVGRAALVGKGIQPVQTAAIAPLRLEQQGRLERAQQRAEVAVGGVHEHLLAIRVAQKNPPADAIAHGRHADHSGTGGRGAAIAGTTASPAAAP